MRAREPGGRGQGAGIAALARSDGRCASCWPSTGLDRRDRSSAREGLGGLLKDLGGAELHRLGAARGRDPAEAFTAFTADAAAELGPSDGLVSVVGYVPDRDLR